MSGKPDTDFCVASSSLANLYAPDRPVRDRKRPKYLDEGASPEELKEASKQRKRKPAKRPAPEPGPSRKAKSLPAPIVAPESTDEEAPQPPPPKRKSSRNAKSLPEPSDEELIQKKRNRRKQPEGRRKKERKSRRRADPPDEEYEMPDDHSEYEDDDSDYEEEEPTPQKSAKKSAQRKSESQRKKRSRRGADQPDEEYEMPDDVSEYEDDDSDYEEEEPTPQKSAKKSAQRKSDSQRKKGTSKKTPNKTKETPKRRKRIGEDTTDESYVGESKEELQSRLAEMEEPEPSAPELTVAPRKPRPYPTFHSPIVFHFFIRHCLKIQEHKERRGSRKPRPGEDTDPKFVMKISSGFLWRLLLISRRIAFKIQDIQLNTDLIDNSEIVCSGERFIIRNFQGTGGCRMSRRVMDILLAEYRLPLFSECITRSFDETVYAREMPCRVFNATVLTMRKSAQYSMEFRNPYAHSILLTFSTGTIEYGLDILHCLKETFPQAWRVRFVYLHGDADGPAVKSNKIKETRAMATALKADKVTLNKFVDYFRDEVFHRHPGVIFSVEMACPRSSRLRVDERLGPGKVRVASCAYDDEQNVIQTALLGTYLASQNHVQFRYDNILHSDPRNSARYFLS